MNDFTLAARRYFLSPKVKLGESFKVQIHFYKLY